MLQALKRTHTRGRYLIRPTNYVTIESCWTAIGRPKPSIEQAMRAVAHAAAEAGDSHFYVEVRT